MSQFIIVYLGGNPPATKEEGMEHMEKYRTWLAGLGEAAVSPANPLRNTRTVNADGSVADGSHSSMSGYTIVAADSLDEAIAMAQGCPFLEIGGSLEVSELMQMPF